MKRILVGAMALVLGAVPMMAQSLEDLNIQIHGYATQGFFYTTQNNIFSTNSSNGSPAWTEAVVNLTSQPTPKLRVGVQARYVRVDVAGYDVGPKAHKDSADAAPAAILECRVYGTAASTSDPTPTPKGGLPGMARP